MIDCWNLSICNQLTEDLFTLGIVKIISVEYKTAAQRELLVFQEPEQLCRFAMFTIVKSVIECFRCCYRCCACKGTTALME